MDEERREAFARIRDWLRDIPKDRLSEELMQERREEVEMADRA